MKKWEVYEEVAAALLDKFASDFGLERVEGKQKIPGAGEETGRLPFVKGECVKLRDFVAPLLTSVHIYIILGSRC